MYLKIMRLFEQTTLLISVDGMAIGYAMFISKKRGGVTASPIKLNIMDSVEKKLVMSLVNTMIAFEPSERPSIDMVLKELEVILG